MSRSNLSLQIPEDHNDDEDDLTSTWPPLERTSTWNTRRLRMSGRPSEVDLRSRMPPRSPYVDEHTGLLGGGGDGLNRSYTSFSGSIATTPRPGSIHIPRSHSLSLSFSQRLVTALSSPRSRQHEGGNMEDSYASLHQDNRVWYDQVHDSIADAYRVKELRSRKGLRGKLWAWFDATQGWLLVAIIGCITAFIAYFVDITEATVFDIKEGYCRAGWYYSKRKCCPASNKCDDWTLWSEAITINPSTAKSMWINYAVYVGFVVSLSMLSCILTLTSRTVVPSAIQLATLDENLGADHLKENLNLIDETQRGVLGPGDSYDKSPAAPMVYYSAAGSGVAEVKVILSGFVLHGYLGMKTLVVKTFALILSVGSGLSLGKEGPYVHIATCVGNVAARLFDKYNRNDGKRREVLSASAGSGVAVAFGAPIGGVLFSLEEVSYYFPPKTLFRTFFCSIVAALSLKFFNPYGTHKIVIFEVRYLTDWRFFEMIAFVLLGSLGGALGALFIKASRFWARSFRRIPVIRKWPILEVFLVALLTGSISYWNKYTKLPVTELLFELARPCDPDGPRTGLCPDMDRVPQVIYYLAIALVIKSILTTITFGIKVPAGIYVPSMVVGGLLGRIVGHIVQYVVYLYPDAGIFSDCKSMSPGQCVTPGVYAMVAAGATMCGVTRLSVTLAVILFELTGSLDHVLPFSLAILVSKWTADALEPLSIYDLLTDMNSYPFLDNKVRPIFTGELGDITPRVRSNRIIDISQSPLVPAKDLRRKLEGLHMAGELDGGLPIVRNGVLVGLIPAPDLEFALDKLENEDSTLCLMTTGVSWTGSEDEEIQEADPTDFGPFIDPAPVTLDIHSPMDLVYECFVKLGLRYICVLRDGRYAGLVHKKSFVKYVRELKEEERLHTI
ncbi:MAG: hypothetical protein M1816_001308 [Peltula sp. TS41687]|nr:MAG: hypothetical protein M1816_001308 [Peltula sp. TS41687]